VALKYKLTKRTLFSLLYSASTILLILLLFPLIQEIFSTELRLISTVIAENLLKVTGLQIERDFTILKVGQMTFDVIPACNGSETLKVLLCTAVIITTMNNKLSLYKKLLVVSFCIPIALTINGLRVTSLVGGSFLLEEVINDQMILHDIIGCCAFACSLFLFYKIAEALSANETKVSKRTTFLLTFTLFILYHLSFLLSCIRDWQGTAYNNNDLYSEYFFLTGCLFLIYSWLKSPINHQKLSLGIGLFSGCMLCSVLIQISGTNNYVQGVNIIACILAIFLAEKGLQTTLTICPLVLIIFCGYPRVNLEISNILNLEISQFINYKIYFCILMVFSWATLKRVQVFMKEGPQITGLRPYKVICLICILSYCTQIIAQNSSQTQEKVKYKYPYLINNWEGFDMKENSEKNEINRLYIDQQQQVGILIIHSNGDRKNLHTPEYCQYGKGWKVSDQQKLNFTNHNKRSISGTHLNLIKGKQQRQFVYWFDNGKETCSTYREFITKDTLYKAKGKSPNWALYIVWTDQGPKTLKKFLKNCHEINTVD
jgi:exosortase